MIEAINRKYPSLFRFEATMTNTVSKRWKLDLIATVVGCRSFSVMHISISNRVYNAHKGDKSRLLRILLQRHLARNPELTVLGIPVAEMLDA